MTEDTQPIHQLNFSKICKSFLTSAVWIAALGAFAVLFSMATEIALIDFLHNNPYRTRTNAVETALLFPFIFFIIFMYLLIVTSLIPLLAKALLLWKSGKPFRLTQFALAMLILVPLSVASWYGYEYLTPDIGAGTGEEWRPFIHGITLVRYLIMLLVEAAIAIFCILRLYLEIRNYKKIKSLMMVGIVSLICIGAVFFTLTRPHNFPDTANVSSQKN